MATKTISIMDDVYELLLMKKRSEESFSQVIRRELSGRKDIMEFAGTWKNVSKENIEDIKNKIKELRKRSTKELIEK